MPSDRQVCIHNSWWTKIIWNKGEECYYTNRLLKKLHNYNESDSDEESQESKTEEPTVNQQIRQMLIHPTLKNSPLVMTTSLSPNTMTTTTTEEAIIATMSQPGDTSTQSQRLAAAMQRAFQQRKKPGPPGGGSGPLGGGSGPPGGGQLQNVQQPVPPTPDVKAKGSLPQIFNGD